MDKTKIEWADATWNPVTGCTKISIGCKNCYAEKQAERLQAMGQKNYVNGFEVATHEHMLKKPLNWKRPRRIFVNSMSDLFHKDVPEKFINRVFNIMALANWHEFLVLTKRPERMAKHVADYLWTQCDGKPLPNVMLGVSVEDQATADERIPLLLQTPAAKRFVSYEPALEYVDFDEYLFYDDGPPCCDGGTQDSPCGCGGVHQYLPLDEGRGLDLIIMGGESGPSYRPMDLSWGRWVYGQCKPAGVSFFFKQTAGREPIPEDLMIREWPD